MMNHIDVSIIIPVHNEAEVLHSLFKRLLPVMQNLQTPYEIIFINDGSTDKSGAILDEYQQKNPSHIRIIHFNGNFGQHMAIMAGFEHAKGTTVITLDADLQNPPEEIPTLLALAKTGHDVVNGFRLNRQDSLWRLWASKCHNKIREIIAPGLKMKDEGCMLRAYHCDVVKAMVNTKEHSTFIPALAMAYAKNPIEIGVKHEARTEGETSYHLYQLFRYNFDLFTNFSLVPLQIITFLGIGVSALSTIFLMYLCVMSIFIGIQIESLLILFGIMFLLMGVLLSSLGIVGEYIGRIFQQVQGRPRFVIKNSVGFE